MADSWYRKPSQGVPLLSAAESIQIVTKQNVSAVKKNMVMPPAGFMSEQFSI